MMPNYADRLRRYNRAGQVQYEWFDDVADYIEELEGKAVQNDAGIIGVETVEEHEDGSATYQFHMDAHARGLLAEEGLKLVLYCAAAKLNVGVVYDFIEDHVRYENDEAT